MRDSLLHLFSFYKPPACFHWILYHSTISFSLSHCHLPLYAFPVCLPAVLLPSPLFAHHECTNNFYPKHTFPTHHPHTWAGCWKCSSMLWAGGMYAGCGWAAAVCCGTWAICTHTSDWSQFQVAGTCTRTRAHPRTLPLPAHCTRTLLHAYLHAFCCFLLTLLKPLTSQNLGRKNKKGKNKGEQGKGEP